MNPAIEALRRAVALLSGSNNDTAEARTEVAEALHILETQPMLWTKAGLLVLPGNGYPSVLRHAESWENHPSAPVLPASGEFVPFVVRFQTSDAQHDDRTFLLQFGQR